MRHANSQLRSAAIHKITHKYLTVLPAGRLRNYTLPVARRANCQQPPQITCGSSLAIRYQLATIPSWIQSLLVVR